MSKKVFEININQEVWQLLHGLSDDDKAEQQLDIFCKALESLVERPEEFYDGCVPSFAVCDHAIKFVNVGPHQWAGKQSKKLSDHSLIAGRWVEVPKQLNWQVAEAVRVADVLTDARVANVLTLEPEETEGAAQ